MIRSAMRVFGLGALAALAMTSVSADAQQIRRLRGTIEAMDGDTFTVKARDGASHRVVLAASARIVGVVKATMADIKPGSFIGSGAVPQADGTQKAVEVHIFPEEMRGTGEGHRPWDGASNGTMTNGTTAGATVTGVDAGAITVKYKEGDKKIIVTPGTPIVRYETGSKSDLKAGAAVTITNVTKKPDGLLEAARVNVGRNGTVPN